MDQRLSLVTLGVADLERAARFYEAGLGWKRGNRDEGVVFFQMPGMILALWSRVSLAEEANAVLAEAKAAGARILKPAEETSWGGYSGYFADPDDHVWEVAHNPFWKIDAEGRVSLA